MNGRSINQPTNQRHPNQAGADVLSKDKYSIPVLLKAYFRHAFDFLEALVAEGLLVKEVGGV